MTRTIGITAITKLKHADMWSAAVKCGSVDKLAAVLRVHRSTVYKWCNLQDVPPSHPSHWWPKKRLDELESALFGLTGKTLDELFPGELREALAFLNAPKTVTTTRQIKLDALLTYAAHTSHRLTGPSPVVEAEHTELQEDINRVLATLTPRERCIVEMRYGLCEWRGKTHTLREIAKVYALHTERVRQILDRAERKMRVPGRAALLESHCVPHTCYDN